MRAGLLRERVVFEGVREVQTGSGFVRKEYGVVLETKAYRRKLGVVRNDEVNASEEFTDSVVVLQVRWNPLINEGQRVWYNNCYYRIKLLDLQVMDHTYLVSCSRIND